MFSIEILDLHWLKGMEEEDDLCLHGSVRVTIGDHVWEEDECCTTAAALQLLRSLTRDLVPDGILQMFPHCGHGMFPGDTPDTVLIIGCGLGLDFSVRHTDGKVILTMEDGASAAVPEAEYRAIVLAFADAVETYCASGKPKRLPEDKTDRESYHTFWREWKSLREKG